MSVISSKLSYGDNEVSVSISSSLSSGILFSHPTFLPHSFFFCPVPFGLQSDNITATLIYICLMNSCFRQRRRGNQFSIEALMEFIDRLGHPCTLVFLIVLILRSFRSSIYHCVPSCVNCSLFTVSYGPLQKERFKREVGRNGFR